MVAPTNNEPELNVQEWAEFRRSFLQTNSYHPEMWDSLSPYQKRWATDTKNTLRSFEEEDKY